MDESAQFTFVDPQSIIFDDSKRQRSSPDPGDLVDSIRRIGIINPIIVHRSLDLIAGRRRLAAALQLEMPLVPVRFYDQLSVIEAKILELEENLKRSDLPWRDMTRAIADLHGLYLLQDHNWTQARTARALGISESLLTFHLRVMEDFTSPSIANAPTVNAAYNILSRKDSRATGDALAEIMEAGASLFAEPVPVGLLEPQGSPPATLLSLQPPPRPEDSDILHADFLEWAPSYQGHRFNFIHCDFPFGINFNSGERSGRDKWVSYQDDPEIYWRLIRCLCTNLDRLMAPSAHLMFWFSMEHYQETIECFQKLAPTLAFQKFPLIWVKSDNVGILPDQKRGPRRVYETALIASREDRLIVKAVSNAHSAPTDKQHHISTKPQPVLAQFFQMFVDENTRLLDPTCGSGSSLRAAEAIGARSVLGLEIEEEHAVNARSALRQFRALRALEKKL